MYDYEEYKRVSKIADRWMPIIIFIMVTGTFGVLALGMLYFKAHP